MLRRFERRSEGERRRMQIESTVSLKDLDQAIDAIEESRESHMGWIGHDSASCDKCRSESVSSIVGDDEHHKICIEKYDHVLRVLRGIRSTYICMGSCDTVRDYLRT